jgi:hypothetical protein
LLPKPDETGSVAVVMTSPPLRVVVVMGGREILVL